MKGKYQGGAFTVTEGGKNYLILLDEGFEDFNTTVCVIVHKSTNILDLEKNLDARGIKYTIYGLSIYPKSVEYTNPIPLADVLSSDGFKPENPVTWICYKYGCFNMEGLCKLKEIPLFILRAKCFRRDEEGRYCVDLGL